MWVEHPLLIVEDNDLNREILREFLKEEYDVLEARNGLEGLAILKRYGSALRGIVLDLNMPVMDGYQFLDHYSGDPEWREVPVLVASADTSAGVENRCLQLGAWDFVLKPYNPDVVLLRLRNNISRRSLAEMQRKQVMDTFARYMEPAVVETLLREGITDEALKGELVNIAVMFVDIRGFTAMSEKLAPTEIVELLDEFLTMAGRSIAKYHGTLDKFIGDCVMAFWGAPTPREDPVLPACQAALEIIKASKEVSRRMEARFGLEVNCGIGLHTGPAVVGNIGTPERMDYTAIGDTVNTASRLESKAPAGKIYISRGVADQLGERGRCTSLGNDFHLKGKAQEVEVLTLDGLTE